MGRVSFLDDGGFREDDDECYRICTECGGDCFPEPSGANGFGIRIMWVCQEHGVQSIRDPFEYLRDRDRIESNTGDSSDGFKPPL